MSFAARLLCALLLAALPSQGLAQSVNPAIGKPKVSAPIGLDIYGSEYAFVSNHIWRLDAGGSYTKDGRAYWKKRPGATDAVFRQDSMFIWAEKCTETEKTLVFRRTYWMPGPPKNFGADISVTNSSFVLAHHPIASLKVLINGHLAISITGSNILKITSAIGSGSFQIKPTEKTLPKLFRTGDNVIEIQITQRKNAGACTATSDPLGIYFKFYGRFLADLYAAPSSAPIDTYVKIKTTHPTGHIQSIITKYSMLRNRGIGEAYFGTLQVTVADDHAFHVIINNVTPSSGPCKATDPGPRVARLTCDLNRMHVGAIASPQFKATLYYDLKPQLTIFGLNADLRSRTDDPMFTNNIRQQRFHLCGDGGELFDPKCKDAKDASALEPMLTD